jgi:hypothetical protein
LAPGVKYRTAAALIHHSPLTIHQCIITPQLACTKKNHA